jgi:2-hydroxyacyl-CoA lyase 1
MDIGRTIIKHEEPRMKLDAATFGVMGVGMPFAIAAKLHYKER